MSQTPAARPPIHMIDAESDQLYNLALGVAERLPDVSAMLLAEIDRAQVHPREAMPRGVVTMGVPVEFVDEASGQRRSARLVLPDKADIEAGKISILTPVGAGLIGLSEGQSISWPDRHGHERPLRIMRVGPASPSSN